jgi:PAS domain S-box-containing protein
VEAGALHQRLRDYETVIETMHCGLVAEDLDGRVLFVNQRLLDWLGYERDELVGHPMTRLLPPELADLAQEDLDAAKEGDLRARLLAVRRKDSTTFPVVAVPQRTTDAAGGIEGYFHVVVDLGAVMTARPVGRSPAFDLRATLGRIALELQSISLFAGSGATLAIPLDHPAIRDLSPRETEVLALLVGGERVPAIARKLHISQHTVRNHLKSMYRKIGVGTQSELIERVRTLHDEPGEPHST